MEIKKIEKKKPRVALLVDAWFPLFGGGQVHCAEIAKSLIKNYDVEIITRKISGRITFFEKQMVDTEGLTIIEVGFKSDFGNPLMRIWYMIAVFFILLRKNIFGPGYNLYHAHAVSSAIPMKLASWITRVPTVMTVHGTTIFQKIWTVKKIIERVVLLETRYDHEISVSENFLKAKNVNKNVSIIPNGINLERFDSVKDQETDTTFDAIFVGRLDFIKGVDVLLKAVKKVVESNEFIQSNKDFLLHIVGEGAEKNALLRLCKKLEIEKHVKFHGKVSGEPLVSLYKSSDVFVLSSRSEGFPLTILEACAAKLPILATDVGDNKKIVLEKENGHLVAPDDIDELAYYLEYFALNPYLKQMGEKGYELVKNKFTWDKIAEETENIYEGILKVKNTPKKRHHMRLVSVLDDPRMPWFIPKIMVERRLYRGEYKGKTSLKFCLTTDVEQSFGSADLPHESGHIAVFLQRYGEMCEAFGIKSTLFFQGDLIPDNVELIKNLQSSGHEIGIHGLHHELWGREKWFLKDPWIHPLERKKLLKKIREIIDQNEIKNVRAFRAPNLVVDLTTLKLLPEFGFEIDSSSPAMLGRKPITKIKDGLCRVPVSRDPMPHVQTRFGLPFGNYLVMNLHNFIKLSDDELLHAINRLRDYHKRNKIPPYLVFLCHSWEFQSRDQMDYTSGENFTEFSKKISMLRENMDLEFCTLTELCTSIYADS